MTGGPQRAGRTVDAALVEFAVATRLSQAGYSHRAARVTARHLVEAESSGCTSHGLQLVPEYLSELERGKVDPRAEPIVVEDTRGQLVLDARAAPGHYALAKAVDLARDRAAESGSAAVWIGDLPHVGRLAHYVPRALNRPGAFLLTVTSVLDPESALVAPPGGGRRLLGSNPLTVGVRGADGRCMAYDGSHAAVPFYRVLEHHRTGQPLPEAGVVTADGRPSTAPADFFAGGSLLPSGGHRGFGLSLALSLLSQLCAPPSGAGRTSAFALVLFPQHTADLGPLADELAAAGAHVPGDQQGSRARPTTLSLRPYIEAALTQSGVTLT